MTHTNNSSHWSQWLFKSFFRKGILIILVASILFNILMMLHIMNRPIVGIKQHQTRLAIREDERNALLLNTLENYTFVMFPSIKRKKKLTRRIKADGLMKRMLSKTESSDGPLTFIKRKQSLLKTDEPDGAIPFTEEQELPKTGPQDGTHSFPTVGQVGPITDSSNSPSTSCPNITSIHDADEIKHYSKDRVCRPHVTPEEACEYTADAFHADSSIEICHHTPGAPYELCTLRVKYTRTDHRRYYTKCDLSPCNNRKQIQLKIVNPSDGEIMTRDFPGRTGNKMMEKYVTEAAKQTAKNGFNFLFIECTGREYGANISQLLTFLPSPKVLKQKQDTANNKVNINVVLLDSISRAHFYRSLPKTVNHLREKQNDPKYNAHIFDFEFFQSVHGHTHENEHALFTGTLYPENYTKQQKEDAPTNMDVFFGIFKQAGYQTMAQNDLCWKSGYGHMDSFKNFDWEEIQKILKSEKSNIDSTGITDTSCLMLSKYDKVTQFNDDGEHQLCYNGQHYHKYILNYIINYLQTIRTITQTKPLFALSEINVAHDDYGIRVRTLDRDLSEFIDKMADEPNTITIIYADHGNTYTGYQYKMLEGRLEMYHPILLTILPKQLGQKFGEKALSNIKTNQYRLLNLLDVRETLVALANYDGRLQLNHMGLFGAISEKRTCDDLQLSTPNYCICDGWDMAVGNTTSQMALAEYAIGELNNQIQRSLVTARGDRTTNDQQHFLFGTCQRLRIQSITNVRERHVDAALVATMDVTLHSGNVVDQQELMTVQVSHQKSDESLKMKFISYNRISKYGVYQDCVDQGVQIKLCICHKTTGGSTILDIVGKTAHIHKINTCLLLIRRTHKENENTQDYVGVDVFEIANVCSDQFFTVVIDAEKSNLVSSKKLPTKVTVEARSIYFVTVMKTEVGYYKSKLKWRFSIIERETTKKSKQKPKASTSSVVVYD